MDGGPHARTPRGEALLTLPGDIVCAGCGTGYVPQYESQTRCAKCATAILERLGPLSTAAVIALLEQATGTAGWREAVTAADFVRVLNEALKIDAKAVEDIFTRHVAVNADLVAHPTIKTAVEGETAYTTVLGLLNGIFGSRTIQGKPCGEIAMGQNRDGSIAHFAIVELVDGEAQARRVEE